MNDHHAPEAQPSPKQQRKNKKLIAIGTVAVIVIALGLLTGIVSGGEPDPIEVAKAYVADETDSLGEDLAAVIQDAVRAEGLLAAVTAELAGEWFEDRINDAVTWGYEEYEMTDTGETGVLATATVVVDVPTLGTISAVLPFFLRVEGDKVTRTGVLVNRLDVDVDPRWNLFQ